LLDLSWFSLYYRSMAIVLNINTQRTKRDFAKWRKKIYMEVYEVDITDDNKVLQLHWALGEMTNVSIRELLLTYMEKWGIEDDRGTKKKKK